MNKITFNKNKKNFMSEKDICSNLHDINKGMDFIKDSILLFKKYIDKDGGISYINSGHIESFKQLYPDLFNNLDEYFITIMNKINFLKEEDEKFNFLYKSNILLSNNFNSLKKHF
jgi:hypothetical protein